MLDELFEEVLTKFPEAKNTNRDIPENSRLTIKRMDARFGDHKTQWDINNEIEVKAIRDVFKSLKAQGYTAFYVKPNGEAGGRMDDFDPKAGSLIMVPQRKGG